LTRPKGKVGLIFFFLSFALSKLISWTNIVFIWFQFKQLIIIVLPSWSSKFFVANFDL
jgi:hypothetical protein